MSKGAAERPPPPPAHAGGGDPYGDFPADVDFDALDAAVEGAAGVGVGASAGASKFLGALADPSLPVRNRRATPLRGGQARGGPAHLSFTRYKIVDVAEDLSTYTKTLLVSQWQVETDGEGSDSRMEYESFTSPSKAGRVLPPPGPSKVDGCLHLRGEWYHTLCDAGDVVHLCSLSGRFRTDVDSLPIILHTNPPPRSDLEDDLLLVMHPDVLVTPTTISETVSCTRRAVLRSRLGSSGLTSKSAIIGTMRHDLFERCMSEHGFSHEFAARHADRIVRNQAEQLIGCSIYDDAEARESVLRVLPQVQRFAHEYTSFPNGAYDRRALGNKLEGHGTLSDVRFCANSVYRTEEAAISPELGLKGNVDVTVVASTAAYSKHPSISGSPKNLALMGLELKTGHNQNPQNAHMAQLALYTVMLRVRHGSTVNKNHHTTNPSNEKAVSHEGIESGASVGGVLLYLNHESYRAVHVSPALGEVKSLMGQRNVVAADMRRAARPRGVELSYSESKRGLKDAKHGGNPSENEVKSGDAVRRCITILPAPPVVLPEVLPMSHACATCYSNRECMMYAAADADLGITQAHSPLLRHFTGHLNRQELQYFKDWDRLIDLEALSSHHEMAKAWLLPPVERERLTGKCMSEMEVDEASLSASDTNLTAKGDEAIQDESLSIILRFCRTPDAANKTPLSNLRFETGSRVVISTHADIFSNETPTQNYKALNPRHKQRFRHQMHIVRGTLHRLDDESAHVRLPKKDVALISEFLGTDNHDTAAKIPRSRGHGRRPLFRLDKDDVSTGIGTLRQNLINVFTKDITPFSMRNEVTSRREGNEANFEHLQRRMPWLRNAVINLDHQPRFLPNLVDTMFTKNSSAAPDIPGCKLNDLALEFLQLNPDQRSAVEKVISAQDYTVIQGLPGTGKTSTIAFVARLLASHGKRVLITSYTHAAVDNLLIKLMRSGMNSSQSSDLLRIGPKSACHVDVHSILAPSIALEREYELGDTGRNFADWSVDGKPTAKTLHNVISKARIIGVSALTVPRTPLLVGQQFDVVIVDEAGQISQPAILGVLMAADSFILVGDHMQLPPLVSSEAAEKGGYGISMLKRLADKFPSCVAQLTLQYRMHQDICRLCNDVVYKGALKCADEKVRSSKLLLKRYPNAVPLPHNPEHANNAGWLMRVLDPDRPVVFLDTDAIGMADCLVNDASKTPVSSVSLTFKGLEHSRGRANGGNIVNETEAVLVRGIIRGLLKCGLNVASIGVICPYRSQLRLLDDDPFLARMKRAGLEVSTIDRYQGRDKSAIVLSLVRSNSKGKAGKLLEDFRRLNVAFSRAKRKLIILGSLLTLRSGSEALKPVIETLVKERWIEHLPRNALPLYDSFTSQQQSQC